MDCRTVREFADSFLSQELLVETNHEVLRHLETCAACRAELAARDEIRGRLRRAFASASDLQVRPEFAAELTNKLRQPAPSISRRSVLRSWWTAAAGLLLAAGGGTIAVRQARSRSQLAALAVAAAGDHQNCAIKFNLAEQPIPLEDAARRYDPAYATLATMTLPSGVVALARHSCVFEGRRFGHVVFKHSDHVVSLLVTIGDGEASAAPALVPTNSALRVAAFDVGTHAVFVVSDLPDHDTLAVAQSLVEPVRQALA